MISERTLINFLGRGSLGLPPNHGNGPLFCCCVFPRARDELFEGLPARILVLLEFFSDPSGSFNEMLR